MNWAIVEMDTARLDGWYAIKADAEGVAAYYAETYPEHRYLVVPFTPGNAKALGLSARGRWFDASRKIPAFREPAA